MVVKQVPMSNIERTIFDSTLLLAGVLCLWGVCGSLKGVGNGPEQVLVVVLKEKHMAAGCSGLGVVIHNFAA